MFVYGVAIPSNWANVPFIQSIKKKTHVYILHCLVRRKTFATVRVFVTNPIPEYKENMEP